MVPISSYDTAGSFLILGCNNGSIYYIGESRGVLSLEPLRTFSAVRWVAKRVPLNSDVQKFPLRMKDNDLLVTELYRDPTEDAITALSVYLTPKTSESLLSAPPPILAMLLLVSNQLTFPVM